MKRAHRNAANNTQSVADSSGNNNEQKVIKQQVQQAIPAKDETSSVTAVDQ